MFDTILLTNNILVKTNYSAKFAVDYIEGVLYDVLIRARDYIHNGHQLLTHPLSGSVKPNETPYKSILLSAQKQDIDFSSLKIIENSITLFNSFAKRNIPDNYLENLREVDLTLISSAITSHLKK